MSRAIELMTNTFMPTGGQIMPKVTAITMMTPNHTGSKPSCVIAGKTIGTVSRIIASSSITAPRMK